MCGLLGMAGRAPQDDSELQRLHGALDSLAHRGPNDRRVLAGPQHFLGFRRLAILDLSPAGGQPQRRGAWDVAFNGEIYNFAELRAELRAAGDVITSPGDAEVVAAWVARHGTAGLPRLQGMFAVAAVHRPSGRVILARDRLGIKPLYYAVQAQTLFFASTAAAVVAAMGQSPRPSPAGIGGYLAIGLCWGETTAFDGVRRLPPGAFGVWEPQASAPQITAWASWPPAHRPGVPPPSDALLDATLQERVAAHLESDVPLGIFLSGGIDSGLIASYASAAQRRAGRPPPLLLTVGFPSDPQRDEVALASSVARHIGGTHRVVRLTQAENPLDWDALAGAYDEPMADSSAIPTLLLNKVAAQNATVWLSGDGGDEAFLGYRHQHAGMRWLQRTQAIAKLLPFLRHAAPWLPAGSLTRYRLEKAAVRPALRDLAFWNLPQDPVLRQVLTHRAWALMQASLEPVEAALATWRHLAPATRLRAVDYRFFLEADGLVKMDRASMWHSVEVRVPFCDAAITDLAAAWPPGDLLQGGQGKQPLRRLAEQRLPAAVARGGKRGFGVPLSHVFTVADERFILARGRQVAWLAEFIDFTALARLLTVWRNAPRRNLDNIVWRLIALCVWAHRWAP